MTHGTRCIYRYSAAVHEEDPVVFPNLRKQLIERDGCVVTFAKDYGMWALVHMANGHKMYAHYKELEPIATNQTPAGVQEEMGL